MIESGLLFNLTARLLPVAEQILGDIVLAA